MDRTDDVGSIARAFEHDRLAVPADVRQDVITVGIIDQQAIVVMPFEER